MGDDKLLCGLSITLAALKQREAFSSDPQEAIWNERPVRCFYVRYYQMGPGALSL